MSSISLVTAADRRDLELCALQCESIDRHLICYVKHHLVVPDEDLALFQRFDGIRRVVVPASQLLPNWLKPLPRLVQHKRLRYWWSLRTSPVNGRHVARILKIAAASAFPEDRHCLIDPDVVFFRRFDLSMMLRPRLAPLFNLPDDLLSDSPTHTRLVRTSRRLLGLPEPSFPATDFISCIVVWDRRTARALIERIEAVTGAEWIEALCRTRAFSEHMLYGYFVQNNRQHLSEHVSTSRARCLSWDANMLDRAAIEATLQSAGEDCVAFSAARFAGSSTDTLRSALAGLAERQKPSHRGVTA